MGATAISVKGLRKSYGSFEAVRGIDLEVAEGEVFGFLGPNGAGKTTTIEILEGYRDRDAGEVRVLGVDPARPTRTWRERIGLVLQECELDPHLTVLETVRLFARLYAWPRPVDETIGLVGLDQKRNARISSLSGGQRRRVDVAVGIIGDPDLIFLDEPTTGFDPTARRDAWSMIEGLRELGKTVFLTTHYMDEAQQLADRVAILRAGELIAEGTTDEIGAQIGAATVIRFRIPEGQTAAAISKSLRLPVAEDGGFGEIVSDEPQATLHALIAWARRRKIVLDGLSAERPSLEDIFLELTAASSQAQAAEEGAEDA